MKSMAISRLRGTFQNKSISGQSVILSKKVKNFLDKHPEYYSKSLTWTCFPRYISERWLFYVIGFTLESATEQTAVTGKIIWIKNRSDGKIDICVGVKQRHHNDFRLIIKSRRDQYYRKGSYFRFDCKLINGELYSLGAEKVNARNGNRHKPAKPRYGSGTGKNWKNRDKRVQAQRMG